MLAKPMMLNVGFANIKAGKGQRGQTDSMPFKFCQFKQQHQRLMKTASPKKLWLNTVLIMCGVGLMLQPQ